MGGKYYAETLSFSSTFYGICILNATIKQIKEWATFREILPSFVSPSIPSISGYCLQGVVLDC